MSNKTICDNCGKTTSDKLEDGWFCFSIDSGWHKEAEKFGLKSSHNRWDLCSKCSKEKITKILKIINKK